MKLKEYKKLWEDYFINAIKKDIYIPENPVLRKYYDSYHSTTKGTDRLNEYIPEPYLGNFETAEIAQINLNPGPPIDFQNWVDGYEVNEIRNYILRGTEDTYERWAKKFIYMDYERNNKGTKFVKNRVKYFQNVLSRDDITKDDLLNIELYAWHSNKYGKLENEKEIFREFILEPLMDTSIKYIFLLRNGVLDMAERVGIPLQKIDCEWHTDKLTVKMCKWKDRYFIGTKNNVPGYPGKAEDQKLVRDILRKL